MGTEEQGEVRSLCPRIACEPPIPILDPPTSQLLPQGSDMETLDDTEDPAEEEDDGRRRHNTGPEDRMQRMKAKEVSQASVDCGRLAGSGWLSKQSHQSMHMRLDGFDTT